MNLIKKSGILAFAVIAVFLLLDAGLFLLFSAKYPREIISATELYGTDLNNLKNLELDGNGILSATSDDPQIYYFFGGEKDICTVTVDVSYVGEISSDAEFYLLPDYEYIKTNVSSNKITALFYCQNSVTGIRIDPATLEGSSLKIESVVLNAHKDILMFCSKYLALFYGIFLLLIMEVCFWRKMVELKKIKLAKMGMADRTAVFVFLISIQIFIKLAVYFIVFKFEMFVNADYIELLWWLFLYSNSMFSVFALWTRCSGRQQCLWNDLILLGLWAITQFSIMEVTNLSGFTFKNCSYLLMNLLCCLIPAILLLLLFRRCTLSIVVCTLFYTVLAIVNHYYGKLRDNPLEWSDIVQARTAVNVISNYTFSLDSVVLASILAVMSIILCLGLTIGVVSCVFRLKQLMVCGVFMIITLGCFCACLPKFNRDQAWDIPTNSALYGYLLSFVSYAKSSIATEKPEDYSQAVVDSILGESQISSDGNEVSTPNIIVIMNESFSDLPSIYEFETNIDALPNIHAMIEGENTITGSLLVSVIGGGTANTEYEFLTGNSLYNLPVGCSPYVQFLSSNQQSIAWHLQNLGYSTIGYHPYYGNGYGRNTRYVLLGLSPFYSISDDLPNDDYLRSYLSDSSDFNNIIYLYESKSEDEPFFIFNVTMQNHGGYTYGLDATVIPELDSLQLSDLEEYLTLIHETDVAFAELVDYFSQVEEDTIILMFGDHQPSLDSETYDVLDEFSDADTDADGNINYLSSFIIWANFDINEASDVITSPNYLRSILLDQAGVDLTAYESYLLNLMEEYPAINAYGYYDSNGKWCERETAEVGSSLWEYSCLEYNNMFDKKNMTEEYYY